MFSVWGGMHSVYFLVSKPVTTLNSPACICLGVLGVSWHHVHSHYAHFISFTFAEFVQFWCRLRFYQMPQTFSPLCEWNHRPSSLRLTFARRRRINNFRPPHLNFRWVNQRRSERCRGRRWNVNKANCSITCRTLLPPPPPSAWQHGCTLSLCDFVRLHQVNRWVNKLVFTWCFRCIGLILL